MSTTSLPRGRAGRMLAMGLLVVAIAVLWLGIVTPLVDWHAARDEEVQRKHALADRLEALAASLPDWRRAAQTDTAAVPGAALIDAGSDALAAASLQGAVQELALRTGLAVSSMEILAPEARGAYRRIAVRVAADGKYATILAMLRALAESDPRMLVDALALRGPDARSRSDDPPLAANFTIIGFRAAGPQ